MNDIVQAFKDPIIDNHYDTIVIGSGIGGLIAANYLADAGVKVLLIERHQLIGGYFHGGWHKKFYFDYGTQSHEIKGALYPAVKHFGLLDKINFKKCNHSFVSENNLRLKMGSLKDARNAFASAFSESEKQINDYFDYYQPVQKIAEQLNIDGMGGLMSQNTYGLLDDIDGQYWRGKSYYGEMMEYDMVSSSRKARALLGRSRAARILTNFGYRNQSVLASGIFWHLWQDDYYYTAEGNQDFANILAHNICKNGGTVAIETEATEIIIDDKRVTGVRLGDHKVVQADSVICNGDLLHTFQQLMKGHPLIRDTMCKAESVPTSEAFFTAFIGTSIPVDELRAVLNDSHHTWFFPDCDFADPFDLNFHKNLPVEISAPVLQNTSLSQSDGTQIVLQSFSSYAWMKYWNINRIGKRTRQYLNLKKLVADQLIDNAAKHIPDLKNRITFKMCGSPVTHVRYTGNNQGATAGWTWNPKRTLYRLNEQGVKTPFENLFFSGHWTMYPGGLLTAAVSGKLAADQVLGVSC